VALFALAKSSESAESSFANFQPKSELVGPGEFVSQDTLVALLKHGFNSDPDG